MLEIYKDRLRTMELNLYSNRAYMSEMRIAVLEQRIQDYKEFIEVLKNL